MYVSHLVLHDFRSYADVEVVLEPGPTAFIGSNGQGKTNLVEAIDYLSRLTSHRVATDAPLVRAGADQAVIRAAVVKDGRTAVLEVEINPGKANRARVNKSPLPKTRDLVGLVRTVVFSPEDLALVKGDPAERRRFLDDLLVLRTPRLAGVRADYERILRQRNSLLKTAGHARRGSSSEDSTAVHARASGTPTWPGSAPRSWPSVSPWSHDLRPYLGNAYATVARGAPRDAAEAEYKPSFELPDDAVTGQGDRGALTEGLLAALAERQQRRARPRRLPRRPPSRRPGAQPRSRGRGLLGFPVRGYASHGESWSFALALRLASYDLLRADGDDPILVLDDVFAELDTERRAQLAELVAGAEQVLVTAAVDDDVPEKLAGTRFRVSGGEVTRVD